MNITSDPSKSYKVASLSPSLDVEAQLEQWRSPLHAAAAAAEPAGAPRQQTVVFEAVTFEVQSGRGRARRTRALLRGVSGFVRPGTTLAVLGPSGSG